MSAIPSVDPRTGAVTDTGLAQTSVAELSEIAGQAVAAGGGLAQLGRAGRARMLREMADALQEDREQLVSVADAETGLGEQRLGGELTRTCYQLRFMSEVIEDGAYLEATIDHPRQSPMGPLPDLRRMLRPVGPVGVFGASNFPFAFSVAGGDTASALAAGCPVIIKAHEAHPATSVREWTRLSSAAARAGAPPGTVALIHGRAAGTALVEHPAVQAIGFTGSLAAGRLLYDIACARPEPIAFYGELGALNAVVVSPAAAEVRHQEIAAGLAASFTLSAGQFCTKPGMVFLPAGPGGTQILEELTRLVARAAAAPLLSARTADAFAAGSADRLSMPGVTQAARGMPPEQAGGYWTAPLLLEVAPTQVRGALLEECFGPVIVAVTYSADHELLSVLSQLGGALTMSIHAADPPDALTRKVLEVAQGQVGRVIWNGYPTGVAVSWAMQHGGPYPATTNSLHTSVGSASIRRWLRPVTYQDTPASVLPPELRDEDPGIPRRIDGKLIAASRPEIPVSQG